jgi:hypothetical protein
MMAILRVGKRAAMMTACVVVASALGVTQAHVQRTAAQGGGGPQAPRFEVDPFWPKPLPQHWVLGSTIGVDVDANDNVWVIHRGRATQDTKEIYAAQNPPMAECCSPAPPVLAFDASGKLIRSWGGPGEGYEWPQSNHGITVQSDGTVWIGGNGANDGHVLKFSSDGTFLKQFGFMYANAGSTDPWAFRQVAKIFLDEAAKEAYLADGYGNHRVAVVDMDTGKMKRFWGAYGRPPTDENLGRYNPSAPAAQQFRTPVHCAEVSKDGLVYVCDRPNNRLQIFTKDGKFQKEVTIAKNTLGDGAVWEVEFSKDPAQRYVYVADGANHHVYIYDRTSMELLTQFGDGGRQPGQWYAVHSIATDSKGNLYTTETYEGKRVQKFVYKGLTPVTKKDQGTVWPTTTTGTK